MFAVSVSVNAAMSLTKLFSFLVNQMSHSINGLQPQLIRYMAIVDTDAPNQSLTLGVNGP